MALTSYQRDIITRTVLGEARASSPSGMQAVANVIKNRSESGRYPGNPASVALQHSKNGTYQFSAWSSTPGVGNNNVYLPASSPAYQRASAIVDKVFSGDLPDITNGATSYYAAGTPTPYWWKSEAPHGGVDIGGNIFAQKYSSSAAARAAAGVGTATAAAAARETDAQTAAIFAQYGGYTGNEVTSPIDSYTEGPDNYSLSAAQQAAVVGATNTKGYQTGQVYHLASGAAFRANADGSFTKVANQPRAETLIQLAFDPKVQQLQAAANNIVNTVRTVDPGAAVRGIGSAAGSFFGGIFGRGSGVQTTPAGYNQVTEAQRNALDALPPSSLVSQVHPATVGDRAQELASTTTDAGWNTFDSSGYNRYGFSKEEVAGINGPVPLADPTITKTSWADDYYPTTFAKPDSEFPPAYDDANPPPVPYTRPPFAYDDTAPTPIAATPHVVTDPITGARTPMPRTPVEQAQATAPIQLYAGTNGYIYASKPGGGYAQVGKVNPQLTPAAQYSIGAAKALASQPNGDVGNHPSTYNSVGVANSLV